MNLSGCQAPWHFRQNSARVNFSEDMINIYICLFEKPIFQSNLDTVV